MFQPSCRACGMRRVCRDSAVSWIFFFIGVLATVALRIIEPLRVVNPLYAKFSWYIGVAGFFLFFIYKYKVSHKRSKIIQETKLLDKLSTKKTLTHEEDRLIMEIICSQDNPKERINFFIIFALSALAIAVALWIEFTTPT